jgi:hypothetical protein
MDGRLVDSGIAASLAAPVERLRSALNEEYISGDAFWSHVLPLSATVISIKEVAEVALIKIVGRAGMPTRLERFRQALVDVKEAAAAALTHVEQSSAVGQGFLKQAWAYQGDGLLHALRTRTEPEVLVEEAAVVLVDPVQGGGGAAYLPYNLLHIEAVAKDPVPELPEIVRLAWLVSVLNLDLPRYSELVSPKSVPLVAALAMIPVTLSAAEALALVRKDEMNMKRALSLWLPTAEKAEEWSALLLQWWQAYDSLRPPLGTALAGLEKMLSTFPVI